MKPNSKSYDTTQTTAAEHGIVLGQKPSCVFWFLVHAAHMSVAKSAGKVKGFSFDSNMLCLPCCFADHTGTGGPVGDVGCATW